MDFQINDSESYFHQYGVDDGSTSLLEIEDNDYEDNLRLATHSKRSACTVPGWSKIRKHPKRTAVALVVFIVVAACFSVGLYVLMRHHRDSDNPFSALDSPSPIISAGSNNTNVANISAPSTLEELLASQPLIDTHIDWPWEIRKLIERSPNNSLYGLGNLDSLPSLNTDINRLRKGMVGGVFWSAYSPCYPAASREKFLMEQIDLIYEIASLRPDVFAIATSVDEALAVFASGRIASFIGVEGGHSMNSSLAVLRDYHRLGVRYMTLTHVCSTAWAECSFAEDFGNLYGGSYPDVRGLTPFGREVVKEMNRLGIAVDISHVSRQTMLDVLNTSRAPVIFSHSNSRHLCNNTRNVPDEVLDLLKTNGGVIQVTFGSNYLTEVARLAFDGFYAQCRIAECSDSEKNAFYANLSVLQDVTYQIQYIVQRIGIDFVGIGSDFDGMGTLLPVGLTDVSMYPALFSSLLNSGFSLGDIGKIAGGNVLRVFREIEATASNLSSELPSGSVYSGPYEGDDGVSNVSSRHGAVATDSSTCSYIGMEILRQGGNAVDAAVASTFCLGVVHPFASGIGGGGFLTYYSRRKADAWGVNFREMAPTAVNSSYYSSTNFSSVNNGTSIGVPGEVAGLWQAHLMWGSLPWAQCVQPAIDLARNGFTVDDMFAWTLQFFHSRIMQFPALAAVFAPGSLNISAQSTFYRPDLAATLTEIQKNGAAGFYEGWVAEALVSDIASAGGSISLEDLKNYFPIVTPAEMSSYKNFTLFGHTLPASGATIVFEILNVLEQFDNIDNVEDNLANYDPVTWHRLVECMKWAFADHENFGDPFYANLSGIFPDNLNLSRAEFIRSRINDSTTFNSSYYTSIGSPPDDHGTTHLSVVDSFGNAVALTSTVNNGFGSGVLSSSTGVLFNDQMSDFTTLPGVPNGFGLFSSSSNLVEAHKRPLSSAAPMVVVGPDQEVFVCIGASGGPMIPTSVVQVLLDIFNWNAPEFAVSKPRIHHQLYPNVVKVETNFSETVRQGLLDRGHVLVNNSYMMDGQMHGVVQVVTHSYKGGVHTYRAASDPRKGGNASIFK